jgi:hypothetical protein
VLPAWPDADRRSRLVFIVKDLDKSFVERLWNVGRNEPDPTGTAVLPSQGKRPMEFIVRASKVVG